jgi:hypothetical protein
MRPVFVTVLRCASAGSCSLSLDNRCVAHPAARCAAPFNFLAGAISVALTVRSDGSRDRERSAAHCAAAP